MFENKKKIVLFKFISDFLYYTHPYTHSNFIYIFENFKNNNTNSKIINTPNQQQHQHQQQQFNSFFFKFV